MKAKRITAALLTAALSVSILTGCGINKNATFATFGDGRDVSLGMVNFLCRLEQTYSDDIYTSWYGEDVWNMDLYGIGMTPADQVKSSVAERAHEMYTLAKAENMSKYGVEITEADKAAIKDAASKFMADNSKEAIKEMGATQEIVEEALTLMTIQSRMSEVIRAEADTNVSDEEANMRAYTMVTISRKGSTNEAGEYVEYTEEDLAKVDADAKEFASKVKAADADFDKVVEEFGYKSSTGTYDADNTSLAEDVKAALDKLKEGQIASLITTDSAHYVVRLDKETDEEATEKNRESIISERQDEKYSEALKEMQTDDGWKAKDSLLNKISFKNHLTLVDPSAKNTESVDTTEAQ